MKFSRYNLIIPSENDTEGYILFNTFTGNCIDIGSDTARKIESNELEEINQDERDLFTKTGVIVESNVDERKYISYLNSHAKFSTKSINSTALLTWACNLKCVYCFEDFESKSAVMTTDEANRYISFLKMLAKEKNAQSVNVLLFGGEPLVNADIGFYILEKMQAFCKENKMSFFNSIITNGTLLNEDIIHKLIEYNCATIQITLDGVKLVHDSRRMYKNGNGSFDDIINTLNSLKRIDNSPPTVIRINIDKTNISDTYELLALLGLQGYDFTKFTVDFGIVRGGTEACSGYSSNCFVESEIGEVLYDLWVFAEQQGFRNNIKPMRRFIYCGLYSDNQFTIAPNCDVYKCWEHVGQKEHLMGKLDEKGSLSMPTYAFYDWMSVDPLKNFECSECVYLPTCGGGCGVISYNETGTYHSTGCFKIKGTVEKQVIKYAEGIIVANKKGHLCTGKHECNNK